MKKIASILILIAGYGAACGQQLSLSDAVNIALKQGYNIRIIRNVAQSRKINNYIGVAGGLPTVTISASDIEQTTDVNQKLNSGTLIKRNGAVGNSYSSNITASMVLYNGSRIVAEKHRLEQLQMQGDAYVNAEIQNTMAAVMARYFDIVRQQAYLKSLEQSITVAQRQLDIVRTQQSVGMANNADLFQSQINLNSLVQQKQAQLLVIDQAKTQLLQTLGLRPDSVIQIRDTITIDPTLTLDTVLYHLRSNPELLASENQVRINQYQEMETSALRIPTLGAVTGYNFNRSQTTAGNVLLNRSIGPFVGLSLGIPIYSGSQYKREKKIAQINVANAQLARDSLANAYRAYAVRTYQAYASSLSQLDSQKVNVELAQKLIDLMLLKFQLHAATIIDLMQAEQSYQNAAFTFINLSYAAKASEIELHRLTDQLTY